MVIGRDSFIFSIAFVTSGGIIIGQMYNTGDKKVVSREDIGDTVLEFRYNLDTPVREDLYQYFSHDSIPVDEKE